MGNTCSNCTHFKTCKYVDDKLKFESSSVSDLPEFMEVEFKCKYFTENKPTSKEGTITITDAQKNQLEKAGIPHILKLSDSTYYETPCKDCSFYNEINSKGRTYVGDSPCQWCSKNPFQITCTLKED